jgi:hypothetical protein
MAESNARRVTRELSSEEEERLRLHRSQIAAELPNLIDNHSQSPNDKQNTVSNAFRGSVEHLSKFDWQEVAFSLSLRIAEVVFPADGRSGCLQ